MRPVQTDTLAHPPAWEAIALQPGLWACYTTAREIGATGAGRTFAGNDRFIHFNCQLAGTFQGRIGRRGVELSVGEVSCGHAAGEHFHVRHCAQLQNIEVMVTPEVLSALAGIDGFERLGGQREADVFIRCARAGRSSLRAATTLTRLLTHAPEQRLRLHAAVLEFLHWQLAAFAHLPECAQPGARERGLLVEARERLLHDLANPPTIAELAEAIGMNQCRLKQAFKAQFGVPIYALFQRERMARARELLHRHNVTETAGLLGYSNISHFSAAFCRQFGMLPGQMRRVCV